jgi:hypothetical protein
MGRFQIYDCSSAFNMAASSGLVDEQNIKLLTA